MKLTAETSILVNASPAKVWQVITTPELISQYLFGTKVETDWQVGSPITYSGEYNGKAYQDKGEILKLEPEKLFESTYWSSMGGKEDKPENYNKVAYELTPRDSQTLVSITQDNIGSEAEKDHMVENWSMVLKKLKEVAEGL